MSEGVMYWAPAVVDDAEIAWLESERVPTCDLPACCRRIAAERGCWNTGSYLDCPSCGAVWRYDEETEN